MKKKLILDTNIWISTLLQIEPYIQLLTILLNKDKAIEVIIDSYGVAES